MKTGISFTFAYVLDILSTVTRMMRKPLAVLLFLWIMGILFKQLNHTFSAVLGPLCYIPGISRTPLCYTAPRRSGEDRAPRWADYPKLIDVQSSTFEQLLDESAGGSGLSLDIKKAEMATRDLIALVRVSDLTSKDRLADVLSEFVEDAKKTGRGLQKLNAKIGGAVDSIMAVNDYAIHSIEAAKAKDSSMFNVIWPFPTNTRTNEVVLRTFHEAMGVLSAHVQRVILEATVSLENLEKLEEALTTLHELVSREDTDLSNAKSELLGALWTRLGGNQRSLRSFNQHLALLRNVGQYRTRALAHVAAALQTMQAISEEMEEMRDRVAAPEILGERIPVEVHVKSINAGLERLKEGRLRAKEREEEIVKKILGDEDGRLMLD
ncbi:hypothetical protein CERSUDRAFT_117428 [Gelatoporia subvermispora B]|uniref:Uncharacterized protein n=1 Tax=Ceriporiopsis subvermispora (strain B) TaxID=914234 RepID=M2QP23_CERS8|nr:hypothetical protein CERSUDRAFT_117428 [Gelatoporia subvermispora B]